MRDDQEIEYVQTGIRLEKRVLKVLKGVAEYNDETPSELLEQLVRHAFDGEPLSFFTPDAINRIRDLKRVYGLHESIIDSATSKDEDLEFLMTLNESTLTEGIGLSSQSSMPWQVTVKNFDKHSGVFRFSTNTKAYDYAMDLVKASNKAFIKMHRGGQQGNGRRWDSRDGTQRSILIEKV